MAEVWKQLATHADEMLRAIFSSTLKSLARQDSLVLASRFLPNPDGGFMPRKTSAVPNNAEATWSARAYSVVIR